VSDPSTKNCRHCGEAILQVARVCKHCRSHQTWAAGQADPRYLALVVLVVLILFSVPFALFQTVETKLHDRLSPPSSCRGKLTVTAIAYDVEQADGHQHLFVRVQVENQWDADVSDPTLRILVLAPSGEVRDTFIRSIYGANIPPREPYWLRVEGGLTADPTTVKEIRAEITQAKCESTWD
jgi:hypothetical protein